jgi:hypothetical protein
MPRILSSLPRLLPHARCDIVFTALRTTTSSQHIVAPFALLEERTLSCRCHPPHLVPLWQARDHEGLIAGRRGRYIRWLLHPGLRPRPYHMVLERPGLHRQPEENSEDAVSTRIIYCNWIPRPFLWSGARLGLLCLARYCDPNLAVKYYCKDGVVRMDIYYGTDT